ncbi:MAG: hypothetical protein HY059_22660 [Proteobacteria bacterium]|nr:hypothetical protein [Pseudomonadota bacterium]
MRHIRTMAVALAAAVLILEMRAPVSACGSAATQANNALRERLSADRQRWSSTPGLSVDEVPMDRCGPDGYIGIRIRKRNADGVELEIGTIDNRPGSDPLNQQIREINRALMPRPSTAPGRRGPGVPR